MARHLQQVVVNQQCEAYALTRRFCTDCEGFRRIKDYGKRKIRTVFGCVEVRNPRIMNCQRFVTPGQSCTISARIRRRRN